MQVEYIFYLDTYGGELIKQPSWHSIITKIEARLKQYTFGRLGDIDIWPIEAKTAACEMTEYLYRYQKRVGKVSENNDGYSVAYDTSKSLEQGLYEIAKVYLSGTGLMDIGVNDDYECRYHTL